MPLNFQIVVAEYFLVPRGCPGKIVASPFQDESGQFPVSTAGKGNKPVVMKLEKLLINPGLIVKSLEVARSDQLEQIAVAPFVLDQQSEMMEGLASWLPATAIGLGDIDFAADDRFYASFLSCYIEIDDAVHVAVVSDSKAIHAQFLGPGDKLGDAAHAVEQAILGVNVKVGKSLGHWPNYSTCAQRAQRGIADHRKFSTSRRASLSRVKCIVWHETLRLRREFPLHLIGGRGEAR